MRNLLFALPFALLPLAAHAHDGGHDHEHEHEHEHGSLGAHEHGVARVDAALDGQTLELELQSPAMNLVGFEHAASTDADKAKVAAARKLLEQPLTLFNLPAAGSCKVTDQKLESPLFGDPAAHEHGADEAKKGEEHHHAHSEIHAHYHFTCASPQALEHLDLARLFSSFPATQKIQVQLIGPSGQQGTDLTPTQSSLKF
jgi:hypothetical protein